jgi:alanyl-tRNA synthetase
MLTDKQIKAEFKERAKNNPEKYYAVHTLRDLGFERKLCPKCSTYYWTSNHSQNTCGNPSCFNGFKFINNTPAKNKLDYIEIWKTFSTLFKKLGYSPIPRYPVVARWRDDTDFVQASIYDFQPYVVSGEIDPPANPLTIPQFCLRFNDIDNVGITGAHYTGFVMIGQHAFQPPNKYDQDKYFRDIYTWLSQGLGLKNEEITFHEDAWAGGGNFGPCMEYFSRGLELGNQVYMLYQQTPSGSKELNIKVLDMGMGQERNAWFSLGKLNSYETTFPTVVKKLYSITGLKADTPLLKRFVPYSSFLNLDETDDIDKAWKRIANNIKVDHKKLKTSILPLAALYSIAEHSRSLLVAISDGQLPSNIGGGYNLRVILRRALSFIDKYKWNISIPQLLELHAQYLKPQFPELKENLKEVTEILEVERKKYIATKEKSLQIIQKLNKSIQEKDLIKLYQTQGITPELIKEHIDIKIPENFYAKVSQTSETKIEEKEEFPFYFKVNKTEVLYYNKDLEFEARVLKVIGDSVILDRTAFYPTSGGQLHDTGKLNESNVIDIYKEGNIIIHKVDQVTFNEGDLVKGIVDKERRNILKKHHSATHIVNAAARKVLGNHIWQAGADKTPEKARLDITHYAQLTSKEITLIEKEANKIISKGYKIEKKVLKRDVAEKKYGFRLYQGGAVPGKDIRTVSIDNIDHEACAGIHCDNTKEVKLIKIIKTSKIQDGIIRLEFKAGDIAIQELKREKELLQQISKILNVQVQQLPARAQELFEKWKLARKAVKKKRSIKIKDLELKIKKYEDLTNQEILEKIAIIFNTQQDHIVKTAQRFIQELNEFKKQLR